MGSQPKKSIKNVVDEGLKMGVFSKQGQEDMVSRRLWGAEWDMAGSDLLSGSHNASGGGHRF